MLSNAALDQNIDRNDFNHKSLMFKFKKLGSVNSSKFEILENL